MEEQAARKDTQGNKQIAWHPAFLQAVKQELIDYKDSLEFKYEYQLTSEPLRIDLIIIKKPKNLVIDKNIARIFRTDNLLEYKSPEDYLSVNDFLKVYAYACLYAAITPDTDLSGITITFVGNRRPRKLLQYLKDVRGYKITETASGIYQVSGDYIPIQIIESKKLPGRENMWLKSLANDLKSGNVKTILEEREKQGQETPMDAYWDVLSKANPEAFLEVRNMARAATFEEVFTKAGIIPEWMERGRKEGREQGREIIARNLLSMGMSVEEIAKATELTVEKVRSLASKG
jgi:hypothetical protein